MEKITCELINLADSQYKQFHCKLMPEISKEKVLGVRTPVLRKYAREIYEREDVDAFLDTLPHQYYDENNLHVELLKLKYNNLDVFLEKLEMFLPFIDNWATCDMFSPKVFKKNPEFIYEKVKQWIKSDKTYTVRFGIVTLLQFYLDDWFQEEMLALVAEIKKDEYYIKMAIAWYFSISLVKQYDKTISYFTTPTLEIWTHNKAIQKAVESRRISDERKAYLRSLKLKK